MSAYQPISYGTKIGRWTVLDRYIDPSNPLNDRRYHCKCDCGTERIIFKNSLKAPPPQGTRSCGCMSKAFLTALSTTHGQSAKRSGSYLTWTAMLARCRHKAEYAHVKVCERWLKFENFYADMGDRPKGMTIDRIDGKGHYCKENCRWSDVKVQARNRRSSVWLTFKGQKKLMIEWSEELGLPQGVLRNRRKLGWTDEEILSIPVIPRV